MLNTLVNDKSVSMGYQWVMFVPTLDVVQDYKGGPLCMANHFSNTLTFMKCLH